MLRARIYIFCGSLTECLPDVYDLLLMGYISNVSTHIRGVLLTGGEAPSIDIVRAECEAADLIYAADSGFDLAVKAGISIDLALGDFDSVVSVKELDLLGPEKVIRFSRNKDHSDTELGLVELNAHGCSYTVLIGGGGGRLDHLMAILSIFERSFYPNVWITRTHQVISIETEYIYSGSPGDIVSFFPAGPDTCTMVSDGLQWPLNNLSWRKGDIGLSNIVVNGTCTVRMITGRLLMVREI